MYNYIKKHPQTLTLEDGNEVKALEVFTEIAGLDENGKKMTNVETAFYGEIRAWFLDIYPEVKNKKDNIIPFHAYLYRSSPNDTYGAYR